MIVLYRLKPLGPWMRSSMPTAFDVAFANRVFGYEKYRIGVKP